MAKVKESSAPSARLLNFFYFATVAVSDGHSETPVRKLMELTLRVCFSIGMLPPHVDASMLPKPPHHSLDFEKIPLNT